MEDKLEQLAREENQCKFFKVCNEPILQSCLTTSHYLCNMYVYYSRLENKEMDLLGNSDDDFYDTKQY